MAKKTVIISEEQLLITNEGEVIKAKDLLYNKQEILCYDNGYKSASINKVKHVEESLISIYDKCKLHITVIETNFYH